MVEIFNTILYWPLFNLLIFLTWLIPGQSVGWGIIALTLLVRAAMWKLQAKSITIPLQQRQYTDEINDIKEKYAKDPAAQSQALIAFYKEKGISPLAGCLPLLIQLPILITLYHVFVNGLKSYDPSLLYSFTSHLETLNKIFFGLNLAEPNKIVLPLLAAVLQFGQTKHMQMLNPPTGKSSDPAVMMSKQMLYIFPVMTFIISSSFPAGLALYWVTTTAAGWAQQVYIAKNYVAPKKKVSVSVKSKQLKSKPKKK